MCHLSMPMCSLSGHWANVPPSLISHALWFESLPQEAIPPPPPRPSREFLSVFPTLKVEDLSSSPYSCVSMYKGGLRAALVYHGRPQLPWKEKAIRDWLHGVLT